MAEPRYQVVRLIESIEAATRTFRCPKVPTHSRFEFVCTATDCKHNRLVCTDCERLDPKHIQQHGPNFMRLQEILSEIVFPPSRDIEDIKRVGKQAQRLVQGFESQREHEKEHIRDHYKRLEGQLTLLVRKHVKRLYEQTLDAMETRRKHLEDLITNILDFGKELSLCDGTEFLRGVEENLKLRYANPTEFVSSILQGLRLKAQLPQAIETWNSEQLKLKVLTKKLGDPVIEMRELEPISHRLQDEVDQTLRSVDVELVFEQDYMSPPRQKGTLDDHHSIVRDKTSGTGHSNSQGGVLSSSHRRPGHQSSSWIGGEATDHDAYEHIGRDLSESYAPPTLRAERVPRVGQGLQIDAGLLEEMATPIRAQPVNK